MLDVILGWLLSGAFNGAVLLIVAVGAAIWCGYKIANSSWDPRDFDN